MVVLEPANQRLLRVTEVAQLTGLTPGRICQLLWAGEIKGRKEGPIWLIPENEIHRIKDRPSKVGRPRSGFPKPALS